ncbi:TetR family transcriptional regulator [Nocardia sp. alder85J]|uniref:TetR family transcriptional regulator n=1 Tax=Nocardia sp. alder85J TaxID=2862949 RepID=UPI001CD66DEC|nr:TetR family transcriptional regulator [Nocardia sp. alder85J]MCX4091717.1 TetR family transcriptional regulator [Nocardia sp. alder85J]
MSEPLPFRRARRPEQVELRRAAIFTAAREALAGRSVREITLRELAEGAGVAKSHVLRYFDSREAVFLELLAEDWAAWLDDLADRIGTAAVPAGDPAQRLGSLLAETLRARPVLCDLFAAMSGELEANVSLASARAFKRRGYDYTTRLAELAARAAPGLSEAAAIAFARALIAGVAGLWPFTNPNEIVATASLEFGQRLGPDRFERELRDTATALIIGFRARGG